VILAQIGSFVPANSAQIGLVDKIFARIGAADNLLEGESTFLVEMRETSHIVASATERSLVLVDEVGRGTATADGLSIAQAVLEWLIVKLKARTLFATHFYELTRLERLYNGVRNVSVSSVERDGEVIFTHEIKPGAAKRSYGIEVAQLAGLPLSVLERARKLLREQNDANTRGLSSGALGQLSIFEVSEQNEADQEELQNLRELRDKIRALDLNNITPLQAQNILAQLCASYGGEK
jgi:DNA mismatch repair protein MutS